jgi:hypothetical protein
MFTSEMLVNKDVRLAGMLPDAIQLPTIYAGAIAMGATHPDVGRAFLQAMKAPAAWLQ